MPCAIKKPINLYRYDKKILILSLFILSATAAQSQNVSKLCYRGFIDGGYCVGLNETHAFDRIELCTSHGFQIVPYLYLGIGTAVHFLPKFEEMAELGQKPFTRSENSTEIPLFGNVRLNFSKKKVTPYLDAKCGKYLTGGNGLYFAFSLGMRFAVNKKSAVNISIGYSEIEYDYEELSLRVDRNTYYSWWEYTPSKELQISNSIDIKLGFEF